MKSLPRRLVVPILLLLISYLQPPLATGNTYATVCGKTGKYKANSTYQDNVRSVTEYIANEASFSGGNGFATTTIGAGPDTVHGLGICRGDTPDNVNCYQWLSTASEAASNSIICPYDKDATFFYDGCIMRFSDQDFLSSKDNEPVVILNNTEMAMPAAVAGSFDVLVDTLLNRTAERAAAAADAGKKKMATGEAVFSAGDPSPETKVYSLAQCTPDMATAWCRDCLAHLMDKLALRIRGALGERVSGVRCNVRFEVYPFYVGEAMVRIEGTTLAPSPAPFPSSPPPTPREVVTPVSSPNKGGIKNKIWIIAVSASLALLLFSILFAFMWTRSRQRDKRNTNSQLQVAPPSTEEAIMIWRMEEGHSEFSTFEFSQIVDATNNFSEINKLGEGGFGRVYKVKYFANFVMPE